jgi:hypothetical protein
MSLSCKVKAKIPKSIVSVAKGKYLLAHPTELVVLMNEPLLAGQLHDEC